MGRLIDLTHQTFGRLRVLERADDYVSPKGQHQPQWLAVCYCGAQVVVLGDSLRGGLTKSCGCWRQDVQRRKSPQHIEALSRAARNQSDAHKDAVRHANRRRRKNAGDAEIHAIFSNSATNR